MTTKTHLFEVHSWTKKNGWFIFWGGNLMSTALIKLKTAKEKFICVRLEWRGEIK